METPAPAPTPMHFWIVGVLAVLWNCMGALDFTMTELRNAEYLKGLTPEMLAYVAAFPAWAILCWGIATWGALIGSVLLLLRQRLAVPVLGASLAGVVPTFTYNYVLTDGIRIMGGMGVLAFAAVIFLIALALFMYARAMAARGVLR